MYATNQNKVTKKSLMLFYIAQKKVDQHSLIDQWVEKGSRTLDLRNHNPTL